LPHLGRQSKSEKLSCGFNRLEQSRPRIEVFIANGWAESLGESWLTVIAFRRLSHLNEKIIMPICVALGIHVVDVLVYPVMQLPSGQSLLFVEQIRTTVAGSAAGTAIDMAKLGLEVYSIGAIGKDSLGDFLISTMQKFGVDTSGIVRKPQVETSCSVLPIRPNGERPVLHTVGASRELTIEDIDFSVIAKADYLHLGGSPLMEKLDGEPAMRVLKFAKEHGVVTTFDVLAVSTPNLTKVVNVCLPYVDYFMPNYEEAAMISGLRRPTEIIRYFLDWGAKCTILRMGANGSTIGLLEGGVLRELRTPAFNVPVVDSTGCGDAYNAGFIKGLSVGWDLEKCAWLGCACGGLVIQGLGSDAGIESFESTVEFARKTPTRPLEA
jgi:sugar/nucleoside kinase (ribokinase family)